MKCREVYLHVCDNLDEDIRSPRCRQIRKHLETCSDCTAYLHSLKATVTLYRSVPSPSVSRIAHARLQKLLRSMVSPSSNRQAWARTRKQSK
jgi:anti-sigma factor RsiW